MHGEIKVMEMMEEDQRLRVWREQRARDAEWIALKQWWVAERAVERAGTKEERQRANAQKTRTAHLYRTELRRAWPKWQAVLAERKRLRLSYARRDRDEDL